MMKHIQLFYETLNEKIGLRYGPIRSNISDRTQQIISNSKPSKVLMRRVKN